MPSDALAVVSLDRMKTELRLGGATAQSRAGETEHDSMLESQIKAGVSYIEKLIGYPILDRSDTYAAYAPYVMDVLILKKAAIRSVTIIRYWTAAATGRTATDGTISVSTLGRTGYADYNDNWYEIYPPGKGWPAANLSLPFKVDVTRGTEPFPDTFADAVVAYVRARYDGLGEIRANDAVKALVRGWKSYTEAV